MRSPPVRCHGEHAGSTGARSNALSGCARGQPPGRSSTARTGDVEEENVSLTVCGGRYMMGRQGVLGSCRRQSKHGVQRRHQLTQLLTSPPRTPGGVNSLYEKPLTARADLPVPAGFASGIRVAAGYLWRRLSPRSFAGRCNGPRSPAPEPRRPVPSRCLKCALECSGAPPCAASAARLAGMAGMDSLRTGCSQPAWQHVLPSTRRRCSRCTRGASNTQRTLTSARRERG